MVGYIEYLHPIRNAGHVLSQVSKHSERPSTSKKTFLESDMRARALQSSVKGILPFMGMAGDERDFSLFFFRFDVSLRRSVTSPNRHSFTLVVRKSFLKL